MKISGPIRFFAAPVVLSVFFAFSAAEVSAQIKFGNSYINISKKTVGGTVEPGDTLEIRLNIWFPNGYNSNAVYFARYVDNVPANTSFIDDSLRLITNEGLVYKRWTLNADGDAATFNAAPPSGHFNIKINLGRNPGSPADNSNNNVTGAGTINTGGTSKNKPVVGGGVLVTTAFKVRVTGNLGDTVVLGGGQIRFKTNNSSGSSDAGVYNAVRYKILIANNDPICPNSIGRNFVAENGGTFGDGTLQNRSDTPIFKIVGYNYIPNVGPSVALPDGNYAIVNNLSPTGSTYQNARKKPYCSVSPTPPANQSCNNRMFGGHWDIIGDHTGSATPGGNAPVAPGTNGGYMLVVNADYATLEAYKQSITGLCPNTSYEFSLWVKNVCTNCGMDSSGTSTYTPGVYPNLTFAIDNLDRYSSGRIDTAGWQKKGFIFRTGMGQTSITISVRNNASGGGGNDWAIDDIALVTCNPNINLIPNNTQQFCFNDQVDISSAVNSFFNNYVYYRFERSVDNGSTWTSAVSGTGAPVQTGGNYYYNAVLAPFLADNAHHMNQYRFTVASTPANLNNADCSFTASTTIVVLVNNCSIILTVKDSAERARKVVTRTGKHMEIHKLVNPFAAHVSFDLIMTRDVMTTISIMDNYGRCIKRMRSKIEKGYHSIIVRDLGHLSKGTYILRVEAGEETINRMIIKAN